MVNDGDLKDEAEVILPDAEGKIKPDKEGKFPEVISRTQYIGVKESLGKKLDAEREKVKGLEEQLKNVIKQEDFNKIKADLDKANADLETANNELKGIKEKSTSEKREVLVKSGLSEEKVKGMSEDALTAALMVLENSHNIPQKKSKPDLGGGGGGSGELQGSPMTLARQAYTK